MPPMAIVSAPARTHCADPQELDHLSYSSFTTYSACPRKFCYRYLEKAPVEFVPASLAFGGAIHRAVEAIHMARLEGAAIPELEDLLREYDKAWREVAGDVPVLHASEEDEKSLRLVAQRMLSVYREHIVAKQSQPQPQIIAIEQAERFQLLLGVPPIAMRLDLLELTETGDLIVSDLKTSRSRWNETKVLEALPQLVLYAQGLMPVLRALGAKRIVPQFVVLTKAKTPVIQTLSPTATQDDVNRLKRQVGEVWHGIRQGVFVQRTGWQCSQCPYKKRCLG